MNRNFSLPSLKPSIVPHQRDNSLLINTTVTTTFSTASLHKTFGDQHPRLSISSALDVSPSVRKGNALTTSHAIISNGKKMLVIEESSPAVLSTPEQVKAQKYMGMLRKNLDMLRQRHEDADRDTSSRDTMYRFYAKDTDKRRNITTPGYVGVQSTGVYYNKYKQMEKELEEQKEGYSAATAYLAKVRSLKMVPSPLGLINMKETLTACRSNSEALNSNMKNNMRETIRANNLQMGDGYAMALSSSMKHLSNTQIVYLPGNRLGK